MLGMRRAVLALFLGGLGAVALRFWRRPEMTGGGGWVPLDLP
jgi:hypothetical protein